jgi:hypothetical protein
MNLELNRIHEEILPMKKINMKKVLLLALVVFGLPISASKTEPVRVGAPVAEAGRICYYLDQCVTHQAWVCFYDCDTKQSYGCRWDGGC